MKNVIFRSVITITGGVLFGALFIWSGVYKIRNPEAFALTIYRFHLIPHSLINILALTLPWVELVAGVSLIVSNIFRSAAMRIVLALLFVYTAAIAVVITKGMEVPCGCFSGGLAQDAVSAWTILRNAVIICLGVCYCALIEQRNKIDIRKT